MAHPIAQQHLQTLRLKYNVVWGAHEECIRALTEARLRGEEPLPALVEREAHTRTLLENAREQLRLAMTESIARGDPSGNR